MERHHHNHVIIIAEAGVNHNGSVDRALEMVHAAAAAGADYVKFQTFKSSDLVSACAEKAEYQKKNCPGCGSTQLEMLRGLELSADAFAMLKRECDAAGIGFLSSPFDSGSIKLLSALDMDFWKIPSGEITNMPYLREVAGMRQPVILSSGMSTLEEVRQAVKILCDGGLTKDRITLLHCNTQYPTPMRDVNLRAMDALRSLGCGSVGYSDHTPGIEIPIAAAALGACVIEKHFTLDVNLPGPDHKASLIPAELSAMVSAIRNVEMALGGSGKKSVSDSERANIAVARRSIVAARHIAKGELLTADNLAVKRPGTGVSPMLWDEVTGTRAVRDFSADELIEL